MVSETGIQPSQRRHTRDAGAGKTLWPMVATASLALVLVAFLARLGLVVLAPDAVVGSPLQPEQPRVENRAVDIASLQSRQLFGTRSTRDEAAPRAATPTANAEPADATRLDLRLDGIVLGKPAAAGFAMIASNGKTASYRIGDRLPVGSRVVLNAIHADRVILENDGRMETLWLYDDAGQGRPAATAAPEAPARQAPQTLATSGAYDPVALVRQYREKYAGQSRSADFLTLSEIVRISPEYRNTQLLGYRLAPGEHLKEFVRLGLKTNDIVTQVNGVELTDIANLPNLFDVMSTASQVTLTLVREGRPMDLSLALDELPRAD